MQRIKQLKDEAYKIATQTHRCAYNYDAEARVSAMNAYALLTIAENMSKDKDNDKKEG